MKQLAFLIVALCAIPTIGRAQEPVIPDGGFAAFGYGFGCGAPAPMTMIPQFVVENDGREETFDVVQLPASTVGAVMVFGDMLGNFPLDDYGMPGCIVYITQSYFSWPLTLNGSTASATFEVGPLPLIDLFWQAFALAPAANAAGIVSSNALWWQPGDA
ncbi:MAG: hypothetical protein KDB80_01335 [Planctomycetes bacterium]|nr:hypothetical protein [Planctomycetota bacterium]